LGRINSSQRFHNDGLVGIDSGGGVVHYFAAIKKLVFLGACLVALASSPVAAQASAPEVVVVVRILNNLVIVRPGGKTEEVDYAGGTNAKSLTDSGITVQRVITKLYQEGYVLKSTYSGSAVSGATLIFLKEK
jgi:hypothetical protein